MLSRSTHPRERAEAAGNVFVVLHHFPFRAGSPDAVSHSPGQWGPLDILAEPRSLRL